MRGPGAHNVLESINGVEPVGGWVEEGHTSRVDICVEIHEGHRMAYFAGLDENGTTVRVDLDAEGWKRLASRARDVYMRLTVADITDPEDA